MTYYVIAYLLMGFLTASVIIRAYGSPGQGDGDKVFGFSLAVIAWPLIAAYHALVIPCKLLVKWIDFLDN